MTLGQRVAVLRDGVLQQIDTPQALYAHPANLFVAAFIGSPPMNLVAADLSDGALRFAGFEIPHRRGLEETLGRPDVILGIRPADIEDADVWTGQELPTIEVLPDVTEDLGSEVNVLFSIDAPPVETDETLAATEDEDTDLFHDDERRATFCAQVDARSKATTGRPVHLSLDPSRFHYFDPDNGLALAPSER